MLWLGVRRREWVKRSGGAGQAQLHSGRTCVRDPPYLLGTARTHVMSTNNTR